MGVSNRFSVDLVRTWVNPSKRPEMAEFEGVGKVRTWTEPGPGLKKGIWREIFGRVLGAWKRAYFSLFFNSNIYVGLFSL